jgi:DNA-binding NarL/FixJ family response regulator
MPLPVPGSDPIRILVVDDHAIFRTGLMALLQNQTDMVIVGEAGDGAEALKIFSELRPDITLMDLQMPPPGGIQTTADIRRLSSDAKIIMLTTYSGDIQAARALSAGASGYLLKTTLRTELIGAIRSVNAGAQHLSPEVADELSLHAGTDGLTPRELMILQQLAEGASNKIIGRNLSIAEQTVKWHLKSIFAKLQAADRTEAVLKAGRRGAFDL